MRDFRVSRMKKTLRIVASTVMISLVILIIGGIAVFLYLYNNGLSGLYNNTEPKEGQIKVACVGDNYHVQTLGSAVPV